MRSVNEHDYVTYPRRFEAYRWYKPIFVGLLSGLFTLIAMFVIDLMSKSFFTTLTNSTSYDDFDVYTAGGAFGNGAMAAAALPCIILAAMIVKDRPVSSYFSSMGGWRWKVFLKTFAAGFIIFGIPSIISFLLRGRTEDLKFTLGGFVLITIFGPLQGIGEELTYRGFIMQTVGSWFGLAIAGLIGQMLIFTAVHPYNIVGVVEIAVSGLLYGLICMFTRGLEAPAVLHILNNMIEIYMTGFGFGKISSEQTVPSVAFNLFLKILFFLFILYADRKLHWFDEEKQIA